MYPDNTGNPCLDDSAFSFIMDNNHAWNGYTLTGDLPQLPPQHEDTHRTHPPFVCAGCLSKNPGLLFAKATEAPENIHPFRQAGCNHISTTPLLEMSHHQTVSPLDTATRGISLGLGLSLASTTSHQDNAAGQANNSVDDQTCSRRFDICNPVE